MAVSLFQNTWWFTDVTFWAGMGIALNSNSSKDAVKRLASNFNAGYVLGGKDTPQHVKASLDLQTPMVVYHLAKYLFLFSTIWLWLYNAIVPNHNGGTIVGTAVSGARSPFIIAFYTTYSLLTAYVSAHDILLHSDKKTWSVEWKRRHVLFPFNLEGQKLFAEPLTKPNKEKQVMDNLRAVKLYVVETVGWGLLSLGLYAAVPRSVFFLVGWTLLIAHRQVLLLADRLFDWLTLETMSNRFDHQFGDMYDIVGKDDKHEFYGRQYQYFNYFCKPLDKVCYTNFFKAVRSNGGSVGEAKAANILGRGALVTAALLVLTLIDAKTTIPVFMYYVVHAAFAYWNHGQSDKFDTFIPRFVTMIVEMELAAHLFYRPILDHLSTTMV